MSKTNRGKPRTSKTYQKKLDVLKKWHEKRTNARKTWTEEKKNQKKPLKSLDWYVEQLRKVEESGSRKKSNSITSTVKKGSWFNK